MVFQGRDEARVGRLPRLIEGLGGRVTAQTTRDHTHFAVAVSSEYLEQAASQLAIAIAHPELSQENVQRELAIIAFELRQTAEDPLYILRDEIFGLSFTKHGYRLPIGGTEKGLASLNRATLQEVHSLYYTAPNMTVVVVGDVIAEQAFSCISQAFSGLPSTQPPVAAAADEPRGVEVRKAPAIEVPESRTFVMLGFPAPAISKDKTGVCAMDVLMAGLSEGNKSRLSSRIIEDKKLAGTLGAMYLTQKDPGLFYIWAVVPPDGIDAYTNVVLAEIAEVRANGISDDELRRAKAIVIGNYAMQSETYIDQASTLGFYDSISSYEFALNYEDLVNAVTAKDIVRLATDYLDPGAYTCATIVRTPEK
jgi:zinc protease